MKTLIFVNSQFNDPKSAIRLVIESYELTLSLIGNFRCYRIIIHIVCVATGTDYTLLVAGKPKTSEVFALVLQYCEHRISRVYMTGHAEERVGPTDAAIELASVFGHPFLEREGVGSFLARKDFFVGNFLDNAISI